MVLEVLLSPCLSSFAGRSCYNCWQELMKYMLWKPVESKIMSCWVSQWCCWVWCYWQCYQIKPRAYTNMTPHVSVSVLGWLCPSCVQSSYSYSIISSVSQAPVSPPLFVVWVVFYLIQIKHVFPFLTAIQVGHKRECVCKCQRDELPLNVCREQECLVCVFIYLFSETERVVVDE